MRNPFKGGEKSRKYVNSHADSAKCNKDSLDYRNPRLYWTKQCNLSPGTRRCRFCCSLVKVTYCNALVTAEALFLINLLFLICTKCSSNLDYFTFHICGLPDITVFKHDTIYPDFQERGEIKCMHKYWEYIQILRIYSHLMLTYHEHKWMMFRWRFTKLPSKYEVTGKCIVYSVTIPAWPMLRI